MRAKERYEHMMKAYSEILPRFSTSRGHVRNEWCRVSLYERAKEAGQLPLHKKFYRLASSMHHGDIAGLISQLDAEMNVELAPSWSWLDDVLTHSLGSLIKCLNYYDEIAQLGFKQRLENGPNEDYVMAVKALI